MTGNNDIVVAGRADRKGEVTGGLGTLTLGGVLLLLTETACSSTRATTG